MSLKQTIVQRDLKSLYASLFLDVDFTPLSSYLAQNLSFCVCFAHRLFGRALGFDWQCALLPESNNNGTVAVVWTTGVYVSLCH